MEQVANHSTVDSLKRKVDLNLGTIIKVTESDDILHLERNRVQADHSHLVLCVSPTHLDIFDNDHLGNNDVALFAVFRDATLESNQDSFSTAVFVLPTAHYAENDVWIIVGTRLGKLRLLSLSTKRELRRFYQTTAGKSVDILTAHASHPGRFASSSGDGRRLCVWSTDRSEPVLEWNDVEVVDMDFSPSDNILFVVFGDGTLARLDLSCENLPLGGEAKKNGAVQIANNNIVSVRCIDDQSVAYYTRHGSVYVINVSPRESRDPVCIKVSNPIRDLPMPRLDLSPRKRHVGMGSADGIVHIFDVSNGQEVR